MFLRKLIVAVAASLCFFLNTPAQPAPQSVNEPGLALEVIFLKGRPPAYQTVYGPRSKKGGAWYGLFGQIANWQLPNGQQPISAVKLVPVVKGETITIKVSVLRGEFLDAEDKVSSYKARENETITVTELEAFGVEPFVIKVIRTFSSADSPTTVNKTASVAIVGLAPVVSTLPQYRLTLHNLSDKNISALSITVIAQGRLRQTRMPLGDNGEPLIKAGETAGLNQSLAIDATASAGGFEPSPPRGQQIVVESLMFEDGSYEGELKPVAGFLGLAVGRRTELKRIIPLLDSALLATDPVSAAETLRSQLNSLSYEPDEAEVAALAAAFPNLEKGEPRISVEVSIHHVRQELRDQLERLQQSDSCSRDFQPWLALTRERYADWLLRLNAIKISQH